MSLHSEISHHTCWWSIDLHFAFGSSGSLGSFRRSWTSSCLASSMSKNCSGGRCPGWSNVHHGGTRRCLWEERCAGQFGSRLRGLQWSPALTFSLEPPITHNWPDCPKSTRDHQSMIKSKTEKNQGNCLQQMLQPSNCILCWSHKFHLTLNIICTRINWIQGKFWIAAWNSVTLSYLLHDLHASVWTHQTLQACFKQTASNCGKTWKHIEIGRIRNHAATPRNSPTFVRLTAEGTDLGTVFGLSLSGGGRGVSKGFSSA